MASGLHRQHRHDSRRLLFQHAMDVSYCDVVDPFEEERFWHRYFRSEPYHDPLLAYEDYAPAYRLGVFHRLGRAGYRTWQDCEAELHLLWDHYKVASLLDWERASEPIHAAWQRVDNALAWKH